MEPKNLLIIMDDEHYAGIVGCYGNPMVKTPHIDRLATGGCRFESAYSPSPICVPARAAFATGRYPHQTGYWDNCIAYDGRVKGWGHRLQREGIPVLSIGKLHYLDEESSTGFDRQILPMHIVDGGDVHGLIRDNPPPRPQCADLAGHIGPGDTSYIRYDRAITREACQWLRSDAARRADGPWVTFVSFICPHYPMVAPPEFYEMYDPAEIPLPKRRLPGSRSNAWFDAFEKSYIWDRFFADDEQRRIAIASYYGLCSFIDDAVGQILQALQEAGLAEDTRVMFTSDHGDNLGARGLWGKSTMYEESATVPMILSGPDVPKGRVVKTPVSLIDGYQTILDGVGLAPEGEERALPGTSLLEIARRPDDTARLIFSEYHATAAISGAYMLRRGRYKYIHYLGVGVELFDLENDPEELTDLSGEQGYAGLLEEFEAALRNILDLEDADRRAKADQQRLIDGYGGRQAVIDRECPSHTPAPGEELV